MKPQQIFSGLESLRLVFDPFLHLFYDSMHPKVVFSAAKRLITVVYSEQGPVVISIAQKILIL